MFERSNGKTVVCFSRSLSNETRCLLIGLPLPLQEQRPVKANDFKKPQRFLMLKPYRVLSLLLLLLVNRRSARGGKDVTKNRSSTEHPVFFCSVFNLGCQYHRPR